MARSPFLDKTDSVRSQLELLAAGIRNRNREQIADAKFDLRQSTPLYRDHMNILASRLASGKLDEVLIDCATAACELYRSTQDVRALLAKAGKRFSPSHVSEAEHILEPLENAIRHVAAVAGMDLPRIQPMNRVGANSPPVSAVPIQEVA